MDELARANDAQRVAALFVLKNGPYFNRPEIDPYDEARDARLYNGPFPAIAHPDCARWGRYWFGGPSCKIRKQMGDDNGCFESGLRSVRLFDGVLEHPAYSHAWRPEWFNLRPPPLHGGWVEDFGFGGWTCHFEQGHYGHAARKATWLYYFSARGHKPFDLIWGPSQASARMDEGFHSAIERKLARESGRKPLKRLSARQRKATPIKMRNVFIDLARRARHG